MSSVQCIEKLGKKFITAQQLDELIHVLDGHLKEHFLRAQQRTEKRKDEDYDEGVEEILEDEVRCSLIITGTRFNFEFAGR